MKSSLVFLVSCFILCQNLNSVEAQGKNASHNVSWGTRSLRDTHLHREVVYKTSSWFGKVTDDYVWEQKNIINPKIITQVAIQDQYQNGNGGYATLTAGGPNQYFVKIHLTSKRFRGYNFIIDIYGM